MAHEGLTIPENEVVPLDRIAEGIFGLRLLFVNVYGVMHADGSWVLIDAGLPFTAGRIERWALHTFGGPPRAILLTHGHFDHVSAAKELAEQWEVPIYAHLLEMPFLTGQRAYAPPDPLAGGGVMALLSPVYPKGPVDLTPRVRPFGGTEILEELGAWGAVPDLPEWRWLHTPGHTVGHVSFFRDADRALIVGDAFCTVQSESLMKVAQMKPELHGPPSYYTPDWPAAKASVIALSELLPMVVIPGHGQPLAGPDVALQLEQLAVRFDALAVPERAKERAREQPGHAA
jgi:glyoxylase-like metal-dependent hydrolase (beta-lactamase superfamily II)